jgi:NAD(P)-dependent dehydrogenase (short-subunit alcohol dehydrogenase family)
VPYPNLVPVMLDVDHDESFRACVAGVFFGAARMMQAVLPSLRERRSGAVVNVTSVAGHASFGGHGFYCATKFALAALSESLAIEMKPFDVKVVGES